jgi:hypothetical protein
MNSGQTGSSDGQATTSMILGLVSVLCMCFTGIPAIIVGILALPNTSPAGKVRAQVGIGVGAIMTVVGIWIGYSNEPKPPSAAAVAEVSTPSTPQPQAPVSTPVETPPAETPVEATPMPTPEPTPVQSTLPAIEQAFCDAVNRARDEYKASMREGANELKLSKIRTSRKNAVLAAVKGGGFQGWVGEISSLKTNSEGKAVLELRLPCDVLIATHNNSFSDMMDNTLISQSSPLFDAIADLGEGKKVKVSGKFMNDSRGINGFQEQSLTENGSMTDPSYVVRFTSVAAAP